MVQLHWRQLPLVWFLAVGCIPATFADDKSSTDLVIQMPPYVIQGERVLPRPESWFYILVPALELTRGRNAVVAPGYEVLSNLNKTNTKLLISELQYRQLAGTLLWPTIIQALPRQPMVVIIDRNKQPELGLAADTAIAWENDPISNAEPLTDLFDSHDYGFDDPANQGSGRIGGSLGSVNQSGTRMDLGGSSNTLEDQSRYHFVPLTRGVVRITARDGSVAAVVSADGRMANSNPPDEEHLAASLSQESVLFALASLPNRPPQWFRSGLGWLAGSTYITPTRITFADTVASFAHQAMPSLSTLLAKNTNLTPGEELLAALFTHYSLYGDNGKNAKRFLKFVEQQSKQSFSEAAFREAFQISTSKMEIYLATYSRTFAAYKSHELKGKLPDMPLFTVKEASQSEVARLQAESLISQGKPDQALGLLRIAYWRGEREPVMLAILAGLEERCGSTDRTKKITHALLALPTPPSRALLVEARLRFREATIGKKTDEKLTPSETKQVMEPLGRAVEAGLITEDVCAFFGEVALRSAGQPHESVMTFLRMAAKNFPGNATIRDAAMLTPASTPTETNKANSS